MELRPLGRGRLHKGVPRGATTNHHEWAQQTNTAILNQKQWCSLWCPSAVTHTHTREGTSPQVPSLSPRWRPAPVIKKETQRKIIKQKYMYPSRINNELTQLKITRQQTRQKPNRINSITNQ